MPPPTLSWLVGCGANDDAAIERLKLNFFAELLRLRMTSEYECPASCQFRTMRVFIVDQFPIRICAQPRADHPFRSTVDA